MMRYRKIGETTGIGRKKFLMERFLDGKRALVYPSYFKLYGLKDVDGGDIYVAASLTKERRLEDHLTWGNITWHEETEDGRAGKILKKY